MAFPFYEVARSPFHHRYEVYLKRPSSNQFLILGLMKKWTIEPGLFQPSRISFNPTTGSGDACVRRLNAYG